MPLSPVSIPLSTINPVPDSLSAAVGAGGMAARNDHSHIRPTSVTAHTSDSNGEATITFSRTFPPFTATPTTPWPGANLSPYEPADNQPILWKVKSWVTDGGGNYTGCVVKLYRAQTLPTQTQLSIGALLTDVITAVNTLSASLSGFNIASGNAANVQFGFIAIMRSS